LYRAKSGGRDQVQMISTSRGLSAISGTGGTGPGGAARADDQEVPSAFRRAQSS
jgi:hypothetical protein